MIKYLKGRRVLCLLCVVLIIMILLKDMIWGRMVVELPDELANAESGTYLSIQGEITGLEQKEYSQYIYLKDGKQKWLVYDYDFLELSLGNTVQVVGELSLFDVARNPGNFDTWAYYQTKGIAAGVKAEGIEVVDSSVYPVRNYLHVLREKGVAHLYEILGEEQGSLLAAMIFGEKNGMDDEQKELYQKIGISHIFAISGLHISLISLVVYQLLRRATGSFVIAGAVSSVFLVLYILLIGMGISAIRAGVMFLMRVGADVTGRVYDIRTSLAVAAMCILLPNPLYLYDGGFLLSFGAILGVIYLVPLWEGILQQGVVWVKRKMQIDSTLWIEKLTSGFAASIGIQCVILPILLYFYYEVSPYSIFLNMIVIPMMTILLGAAMLGIIISLFWYGLGVLLLKFSGLLLQGIDRLSEWTLSLYQSRLILGQPWWKMILVYYLILLGVVWYLNMMSQVEIGEEKRERRYSILGVLCSILPLVLLIPADWSNPAELTITMIDVDQGDSIYVSGDGLGNYLIDGGSTGIYDVGKYRIEPYLRSIGVNHLDYVFISHGDSDHLNGVLEMMERQSLGIEIDTLVLCAEEFQDDALIALMETAQACGTQVAIMEEGMSIVDGELLIQCIAPLATYSGDLGNESSMILDVSLGNLQVLFTGDVEGEGEEELIEILAESGKEYQILKVAHHGSRNSTTAEFLELIHPEVALISAGVDSAYGHPHEETLELLESFGCMIYTTPENGGVVLSYNTNGDTITIEETIVTK